MIIVACLPVAQRSSFIHILCGYITRFLHAGNTIKYTPKPQVRQANYAQGFQATGHLQLV